MTAPGEARPGQAAGWPGRPGWPALGLIVSPRKADRRTPPALPGRTARQPCSVPSPIHLAVSVLWHRRDVAPRCAALRHRVAIPSPGSRGGVCHLGARRRPAAAPFKSRSERCAARTPSALSATPSPLRSATQPSGVTTTRACTESCVRYRRRIRRAETELS